MIDQKTDLQLYILFGGKKLKSYFFKIVFGRKQWSTYISALMKQVSLLFIITYLHLKARGIKQKQKYFPLIITVSYETITKSRIFFQKETGCTL